MSISPTIVYAYNRSKERRLFNSGQLNIGFPILLAENNDYLQDEESEYLTINED